MNLREHLEVLCTSKIWKNRSGKMRMAEKTSKGKWGVLESNKMSKIFADSTMLPNEVVYINFYGDETTMYLLGAGGELKNKNVMLLNPADTSNEYSFWAMVRKSLGLQIPKKVKTSENSITSSSWYEMDSDFVMDEYFKSSTGTIPND